MTGRLIFVIEDDPGMVSVVELACRTLCLSIQAFSTASDFEAVPEIPNSSLILLDLGLTGSNGIDVLRSLARKRCTAPILLMSGEDERLLIMVQKLGISYGVNVVGILQKPFLVADLRERLTAHLEMDGAETQSRRGSLSEQLHRGIIGNELRLHYQPKIAIRTGRVVGCEALVRWQHPERGLLAPGEFLHVAEENGLLGQLSHWVVNEALRQSVAWRKVGCDLNVSVNMPADMLDELSFPDRVERLLSRYGVDGSRLTLEVTEAAAMKGLMTAVDVLARLRLMRICLSIDDFGTGHSSIVKLRQLPFNEMKLDRSFVQDMATDPDARVLVRTMIGLGRNFDMTTVAEGVETSADLEILAELGCEIAQGYHVSRPIPPETFLAWFRQRQATLQSTVSPGEDPT